jgi:hypothetical protein
MHGRSCPGLLTILFLILTPLLLGGQSARVQPDFAVLPPHFVGPAVTETDVPARPVPPPGTIGFFQIARAAGTIFSGTVTAVVRHPPTPRQPVETVAITFRVERAIRGATPGENLTISQWIGLWSGGQRYRVGERALLFLYPPSKLGLTSCVASLMGRFSIDPIGHVLLSQQHLLAFGADPVLGGKLQISFRDLALAVRRAGETQ